MIPESSLSPSQPQPGGFRDLSPLAALRYLGQLRLVDVREPDEYVGPLGHIPGAELLPVATTADAMTAWDRNAPVLLICRSGARSARAGTTLAGLGFTQLYNLLGGMIAWEANDLPRTRDSETPLRRLAGHLLGFFIVAAGGDVPAGTNAFRSALGAAGPSREGLERAVAALGVAPGVEPGQRAAWVAQARSRLAELA